MTTKHQKIRVPLNPLYGPAERMAIGLDIVEVIVERTRKKNVDKNGNPFPGYSKSYRDSLDFKIAGKSPSDVDLTLSGDMLDSLSVLGHANGYVEIGYPEGSQENGKADGNIRGTYGTDKPDRKKARDFLGITKDERDAILARYPVTVDSMASREEALTRLAIRGVSEEISGEVSFEDAGGE